MNNNAVENEIKPGASAYRPDTTFAVTPGVATTAKSNADTTAVLTVATNKGDIPADVGAEVNTTLTGANSTVPPERRIAAAKTAVTAMADTDVAAAVNSAPVGQKGKVLLALAAIPAGADRTAAAQLIAANPVIIQANAPLMASHLNAGDRGAILTVLADVPANEQAAALPRLTLNPTAARTLAALPEKNGAGDPVRAPAITLVMNVAANNPSALLSKVADILKGPKGPEIVAFLGNLSPAEQGKFAPLMGNPQISNAVLNINNPAGRVAALEVFKSVGSSPEKITTALRVIKDPDVTAALAQVPDETQRGQLTMLMGSPSQGDTLRKNIAALPGGPAVQATVLQAMLVPAAPGAANQKPTVMTQDRAVAFTQMAGRVLSKPGLVDAVSGMVPSQVQTTVHLLGGTGQNGTDLRNTVALVGGPGDATARGSLITALANSPAGQSVIRINSGTALNSDNDQAGSLVTLKGQAQDAQRTMNTPGMPDIIAAMPAGEQGRATIALGANTKDGGKLRGDVTQLGAEPGSKLLSTIISITPPLAPANVTLANITAAVKVANDPKVATLPADQRGQAAAILSVLNNGLTNFPAAGAPGRQEAVALLAAVKFPVSGEQKRILANAVMILGNEKVRDNLAALPPTHQVRALLVVAANHNSDQSNAPIRLQLPLVDGAGRNQATQIEDFVRAPGNVAIQTLLK